MQCSTRRRSLQDVAVVSTRHDCLFHGVSSDELRRTPSQHGTRTVVLLLYCSRAASEWQQQHCTILACEHVSSALRCSSCVSTGLPKTVGFHYLHAYNTQHSPISTIAEKHPRTVTGTLLSNFAAPQSQHGTRTVVYYCTVHISISSTVLS